MEQDQFKKWWIVFLAATIIIYVIGLFVPVMDVDAAQYAAISRMMYINHNYIQLHCINHNYLDKPPFLFWAAVVSFHIFGIHTWSYKLPSLLFTLIGIYATFKLGEKLYNKQTARFASLILAACQAFFLFNTDVRTDTILTAAIAVSIWQLWLFIETKKSIHALVGFTFVAIGMLTKGPLGLCVPALALASQLCYQRRWKVFLWPAWWLGLLYILLLLTPMCYGLYEQYGLIGPRFFFWDQSFGRLTGTNVWHNDAGAFFFVHTFIWAFLPWTFLTILSIWDKLITLVKIKFQPAPGEVITYGGFVISFIALSCSHYKLPHYIFNLFPLAAIFTAASLDTILTKYKWMVWIQRVFVLLLLVALMFIVIYLFPLKNGCIWIGLVLLIGSCLYVLFKKAITKDTSTLLGSAAAILAVNLIMNAHFYPSILNYQSGSNLGNYISENNIPVNKTFNYNYMSYSEDFYVGNWIGYSDYINNDSIRFWHNNHLPHYIGGRKEVISHLDNQKLPYQIIYKTPDYPVTLLTSKFLSPATRTSAIDTIYLLEVK